MSRRICTGFTDDEHQSQDYSVLLDGGVVTCIRCGLQIEIYFEGPLRRWRTVEKETR